MIARATVADGTAPISEQAVHALAADVRPDTCLHGGKTVRWATRTSSPATGTIPPWRRSWWTRPSAGPVSVADWWPRCSRRAYPALGWGARQPACRGRGRAAARSHRRPGTAAAASLARNPGPARRRGAGRRHAADLPWTRDDAELLRVNAAAFAWHPEGTWTQARDRRASRRAVVRSRGLFLAFPSEGDPNRLLGFHWTKVHAPENGDPGWGRCTWSASTPTRRAGLADAHARRRLHHLRDRGLGTVLLYVEGDNTAALHTYERLGFERFHVDVAYAAQPDLAVRTV